MSTTTADPGTMTLTEDVVQTVTTDDPGNAAHIVHVPAERSGTTPQALVLAARIEGFPVTALCGHTWVPQRDPKALPVCEGCLAVFRDDPNGHDDRNELPDA